MLLRPAKSFQRKWAEHRYKILKLRQASANDLAGIRQYHYDVDTQGNINLRPVEHFEKPVPVQTETPNDKLSRLLYKKWLRGQILS